MTKQLIIEPTYILHAYVIPLPVPIKFEKKKHSPKNLINKIKTEHMCATCTEQEKQLSESAF